MKRRFCDPDLLVLRHQRLDGNVVMRVGKGVCDALNSLFDCLFHWFGEFSKMKVSLHQSI